MKEMETKQAEMEKMGMKESTQGLTPAEVGHRAQAALERADYHSYAASGVEGSTTDGQDKAWHQEQAQRFFKLAKELTEEVNQRLQNAHLSERKEEVSSRVAQGISVLSSAGKSAKDICLQFAENVANQASQQARNLHQAISQKQDSNQIVETLTPSVDEASLEEHLQADDTMTLRAFDIVLDEIDGVSVFTVSDPSQSKRFSYRFVFAEESSETDSINETSTNQTVKPVVGIVGYLDGQQIAHEAVGGDQECYIYTTGKSTPGMSASSTMLEADKTSSTPAHSIIVDYASDGTRFGVEFLLS